MQFTEALHLLDLPPEVVKTVDRLLAEKKKTSEIGSGPRIPVLEEFIQENLKIAYQFCETAPVGTMDVEMINRLFRETIKECWTS
jgi:predicted nucleotidyltransferase